MASFHAEPEKIQVSQLSPFTAALANTGAREEVTICMAPAKVLCGDFKPEWNYIQQFADAEVHHLYQWPGMWPGCAEAWSACEHADLMGCLPQWPEHAWHMPYEPAYALLPQPLPPPPDSPRMTKDCNICEHLGISTEAERSTSAGTSEDESISDHGFTDIDFDGKVAGMELLAILNGDPDDHDAARPITPPPGLTGVMTPPPGLCSRSITPPPGLYVYETVAPQSEHTSYAVISSTQGLEAISSPRIHALHEDPNGSDADVSGEECASSPWSDPFAQDEPLELSSTSKNEQQASALTPTRQLSSHVRKVRKCRQQQQQRTPGCSKMKKVRTPAQQLCNQFEEKMPEKMVSDASIVANDAAYFPFAWQRWMTLICFVALVLVIAFAFVMPGSKQGNFEQFRSASVPVSVPGASFAWAAAVPEASSIKFGDTELFARTLRMDVEVARGHAYASHVMTKLKALKAALRKTRSSR